MSPYEAEKKSYRSGIKQQLCESIHWHVHFAGTKGDASELENSPVGEIKRKKQHNKREMAKSSSRGSQTSGPLRLQHLYKIQVEGARRAHSYT